MKITPIKTPVVHVHDNLWQLLKANLPTTLPERSIVVVTSKIVALCEDRVVAKQANIESEIIAEKHQLARRESDWFIPASTSKYNLMLTIKHSLLCVSAGIDQSNVQQEYFVLLPKDPFLSAEAIWQFLRTNYQIKELGVVITDSRSQPLRWGIIGTALAFAGFLPLHDLIGTPDLFGRELQMTQVAVAEGVAAAAVLEMGEGSESQPLALVEDVRQAVFIDRPYSTEEKANFMINYEDDMYAPLLQNIDWQKGGGGI